MLEKRYRYNQHLKGKNMRIIISLITASLFAAAGSAAWAEHAPAGPAGTGASAPPATPDKPAEAAKPAAPAIVVKPRESGPDQPLCTGE
jgi:hypothetical protein